MIELKRQDFACNLASRSEILYRLLNFVEVVLVSEICCSCCLADASWPLGDGMFCDITVW